MRFPDEVVVPDIEDAGNAVQYAQLAQDPFRVLHRRVGEDDFRIIEGIEEVSEAGVILQAGFLPLRMGRGEIALDIDEALLEDQPLEGRAEAFRPLPPPGVRLLEGPAKVR